MGITNLFLVIGEPTMEGDVEMPTMEGDTESSFKTKIIYLSFDPKL
jgi:hypothetical protein